MEMKCRNCKHCVWNNGWGCNLVRWEFDLWIGKCENFEKK